MGDTTSFGTMLYDLQQDPGQNTPIQNKAVQARMEIALKKFFKESDAPKELYRRFWP